MYDDITKSSKDAALAYARQGWRVFPVHEPVIYGEGVPPGCTCGDTVCTNKGKHPRTSSGAKDATTDGVQVGAWWDWHKTANIGIATGPGSGVFVLDVDGQTGQENLNHLEDKHGKLPGTFKVRTGRDGGYQLYFRHPEGVRIPNSAGNRLGEKLDIRGDGGYAILPPSRHKSGRRYETMHDRDPAEAPSWLIQKITTKPANKGGGSSGATSGPIPEGQRNDKLASKGGYLRGRGYSADELEAELQRVNEDHCRPPLPADEVSGIARSMNRYPDGGFNRTDVGNARRLIHHFGENIRYCYPWGRWLVWTGKRWETDNGGAVDRYAKQTVRRIYGEAANAADTDDRARLGKWAAASESGARIRAMIDMAKSEEGVSVKPEDFDAAPYAFNMGNGTVDLRTGELRSHDRRDLITKLAPVDADASTFYKFLIRIMDDRGELIGFLQRAIGYSLTADVGERALFICHGDGKNGKSTLLETIHAGAGDYAMRTPTETLMEKRYGGVPNDVARLKGQRFVTAAEAERGHQLAESTVKELTGNDTISARFMRAEWFDFRPTHKIWLSTNYRPEVQGDDPAIWDRIKLIPFEVRIPEGEQDRDLPKKLEAELPGVMAWAIQGAVEWYQNGLQEPEAVKAATAGYREDMDPLKYFLEDECVADPGNRDLHDPVCWLYQRYLEWARDQREEPLKRNEFQKRMSARFGSAEQKKMDGQNKRCYFGVVSKWSDAAKTAGQLRAV